MAPSSIWREPAGNRREAHRHHGLLLGRRGVDADGDPVFIQGAELDTYDLPDTCPALVQSVQAITPGLVSVKMYPGVTHAFDRVTEPDITVTDPFSHLGRGGDVDIKANPEAAAQSRAAMVAFLRARFGL